MVTTSDTKDFETCLEETSNLEQCEEVLEKSPVKITWKQLESHPVEKMFKKQIEYLNNLANGDNELLTMYFFKYSQQLDLLYKNHKQKVKNKKKLASELQSIAKSLREKTGNIEPTYNAVYFNVAGLKQKYPALKLESLMLEEFNSLLEHISINKLPKGELSKEHYLAKIKVSFALIAALGVKGAHLNRITYGDLRRFLTTKKLTLQINSKAVYNYEPATPQLDEWWSSPSIKNLIILLTKDNKTKDLLWSIKTPARYLNLILDNYDPTITAKRLAVRT